MKENSIEEAIERLEYIDRTYSCNNYYSIWDLKCIEILLSDYKRVLKENEELKEDRDKFKKALGRRITYCNELEKDLFENSSNYVIKKQKVKEKIEELDIQISECEYADDDIEERKQDIEKEKRLLLRDKKTLEELLGEE